MKPKTFYRLTIMVKKIMSGLWLTACLLALFAMVAPCFLIFSTGKDGELTVWNLVGLVWCVGVAFVFKYKSR